MLLSYVLSVATDAPLLLPQMGQYTELLVYCALGALIALLWTVRAKVSRGTSLHTLAGRLCDAFIAAAPRPPACHLTHRSRISSCLASPRPRVVSCTTAAHNSRSLACRRCRQCHFWATRSY